VTRAHAMTSASTDCMSTGSHCWGSEVGILRVYVGL
jgi:hypothetical protein